MSITKYKTGGWNPKKLIEEVLCERETEKCVFVGGSRLDKKTAYHSFHDTWNAAHAHLLHKAEGDVAHARHMLQFANDKLGNIKGLKP